MLEIETRVHTDLFHDAGIPEPSSRTRRTPNSVPVDRARFHKGLVVGVDESEVMLTYYSDGSVDGVVRLPDDLLVIEPLKRYSDHSAKWRDGSDTVSTIGNSVAYLASRVANSSIPTHLLSKFDPTRHICGGDTHNALLNRQREIARERAAAESTVSGGAAQSQHGSSTLHRKARRSGVVTDCRAANPIQKCNCPMILVADQTFYTGPYGGEDEAVTAQYMVNTLGAIDVIYRNTEFGGENGIGLTLMDVQVKQARLPHSWAVCLPSVSAAGVPHFEWFSRARVFLYCPELS